MTGCLWLMLTLVTAPVSAEPAMGRGARVEQLIARGTAYRNADLNVAAFDDREPAPMAIAQRA